MGAGRTLTMKYVTELIKKFNEKRAKYPRKDYPHMNDRVIAEGLGISRWRLEAAKRKWAITMKNKIFKLISMRR